MLNDEIYFIVVFFIVTGRTVSEPKFLPTLEIHNQSIFLPNAAASYFISTSENNVFPVNEFLEWEATILSPCLAYTLGNSAKNEKIRNNLLAALKKLNMVLEDKKQLVGVIKRH